MNKEKEEIKYGDPILDWIVSTGRDPMFVSIEALRLLTEYKEHLVQKQPLIPLSEAFEFAAFCTSRGYAWLDQGDTWQDTFTGEMYEKEELFQFFLSHKNSKQE